MVKRGDQRHAHEAQTEQQLHRRAVDREFRHASRPGKRKEHIQHADGDENHGSQAHQVVGQAVRGVGGGDAADRPLQAHPHGDHAKEVKDSGDRAQRRQPSRHRRTRPHTPHGAEKQQHPETELRETATHQRPAGHGWQKVEQRAQPDKRQVNLDEIVNEPPIDNVRHHALGVEEVNQQIGSGEHPRQPERGCEQKPLRRAHLLVGAAVVGLYQTQAHQNEAEKQQRQHFARHRQPFQPACVAVQDPEKTKRDASVPKQPAENQITAIHQHGLAAMTKNPG